jgi:hypothetical protein
MLAHNSLLFVRKGRAHQRVRMLRKYSRQLPKHPGQLPYFLVRLFSDHIETTMSETLNRLTEELRQLNLRIRQQLELAEAELPVINDLINQLAVIDLANGVIILGDVVYQRPYNPGAGPSDSGQVMQAAIAIPGGLGLVLWDSEVFAASAATDNLEREARSRFLPFANCSSAWKALVMQHAESLIERFCFVVCPYGLRTAERNVPDTREDSQ